MKPPRIASREGWLAERRALLEEEKAQSRARDRLAAKRRALPWVPVEESYEFQGAEGQLTLADLFDGRSQLIVQHYMFAPDWQEGCRSCAFWADQFNPAVAHLQARDVSFAAVSEAPYPVLAAFQARMGWRFRWVSAAGSTFGQDYHVSYSPEQIASGATAYNFQPGLHYGEHAPGVSVFARGDDGAIYHTYSCYARGLDALNGAYQLLDLTPAGRDEAGLPYPMSWVRLHDRYD